MGQLLTHVVCKPFGDDTINPQDPLQKRVAGECVNAMFWRSTERMEGSRYIVEMPEGLDPVADSLGRFWSDPDMMHKAGREPLQAEVSLSEPQPVAAPTDLSVLEFDPDAEDLDWNALVDCGFPLPKKTSERRYQLWDGQVVVGSMTEAGEHHFAGVRARIRELRAEHLAPAAGSATDT